METSNTDLYREIETDMHCIYKCKTVTVQYFSQLFYFFFWGGGGGGLFFC